MVVSIDYRLAPETKLAAILEDVRDAFAWVRAEGPKVRRPRRPDRRPGRLGWRLSHADDRPLDRAAPESAGVVLGIR